MQLPFFDRAWYACCPVNVAKRYLKSECRFVVVLFAIYLFIVMVLPLALGIAITYRNVSRERRCPLCGTDTVRIRTVATPILDKISILGSLQRRWCVTCGWHGIARINATQTVPAVAYSLTRVHPSRNVRTEPVRTLGFGGMQWRVLLQCWQENEQYCGQLLFIGPAGHLRRDPKHPFCGPTRAAIVEQALSLSDGLLTYRLRELVSD
jgi:hypothetical protein